MHTLCKVKLFKIKLFISALYFPQSDMSLKIPYITENGMGLISDINLLTLKTLKNDSAIAADPIYQILSSKEKYASLDTKNANVILKVLPEKGKNIILY
jgi:hypothetical protein